MSALKPCPWCWRQPTSRSNPYGTWEIWCSDDTCPATCEVSDDTEADAIAAWNRRAGDDEVETLRAEVVRMKKAASTINEEVCQTLGKVLNYPWLMDDQTNFPGATEVDGVCVGDHVAETLAAEAAERIDKLQAEASEWCQSVQLQQDRVHRQKGEQDALTIAFRKLSAVLRVNMLRHMPDTSHAEIDAAIDACLGPVARAALEDRP